MNPDYDNRTSEFYQGLDTREEYEIKNDITGENYPPLPPRYQMMDIPVVESMVNDDIITLYMNCIINWVKQLKWLTLEETS